MTRENLVKAIYFNDEGWSCPNSDCGDKSAEEYRINDCVGCAEKQLAEYEKQIRAQAVEEYKQALKTVLEEESCIHNIDLDIEASKVIDGF